MSIKNTYGLHTPQITTEKMEILKKAFGEKNVIDVSYGNDLCDSAVIRKFDWYVYFPNTTEVDEDSCESFDTFNIYPHNKDLERWDDDLDVTLKKIDEVIDTIVKSKYYIFKKPDGYLESKMIYEITNFNYVTQVALIRPINSSLDFPGIETVKFEHLKIVK